MLEGMIKGAKQKVAGTAMAAGGTEFIKKMVQESGGVAGLSEKFKSAGLTEVFQSWTKGEVPPKSVRPEQIRTVLGADRIEKFSAKIGMPADQVASKAAEFLPGVIHSLAAKGQTEKLNNPGPH